MPCSFDRCQRSVSGVPQEERLSGQERAAGSCPIEWMLLLMSSGFWGGFRLSGLVVEPGAEGGFQVSVSALPYLEST